MKIGDVVMWSGDDWMVIGFDEGKVQLMEVGLVLVIVLKVK